MYRQHLTLLNGAVGLALVGMLFERYVPWSLREPFLSSLGIGLYRVACVAVLAGTFTAMGFVLRGRERMAAPRSLHMALAVANTLLVLSLLVQAVPPQGATTLEEIMAPSLLATITSLLEPAEPFAYVVLLVSLAGIALKSGAGKHG